MAEQAAESKMEVSNGEQTCNSVEATMESGLQGGTESTCNKTDSSSIPPVVDPEKTLEFAEELMIRGSKAAKEQDHDEATDCFSRALEIRVGHFGELAPECVNAYYKYGCALLYKAQDEADPLGSMPKKEADSDKDGSVKSTTTAESSTAVLSIKVDESESSNNQGKEKAPDDGAGEVEDQEEVETDAEDTAEGDEDETDLDLAWKMLDVARAIAEKHLQNTIEMVDILSALAEVSLEREDVETSLSDYLKALSILKEIVEPNNRHLAELYPCYICRESDGNFRICLCLEIGSKPQEALPYCEKAISICKTRVQQLSEASKVLSSTTLTEAGSESEQGLQHSSSTTNSLCTLEDTEAEIETLTGLSSELEKKLEDLQQLVLNPKSMLSDILGVMAAKASGLEKASSEIGMNSSQMAMSNNNGGFDSPTVSTAHTNGTAGVTDLGVVGRGVKRVQLNSISAESSPAKRHAPEPSPKTDGSDAS